jgi:hypothetical protein
MKSVVSVVERKEYGTQFHQTAFTLIVRSGSTLVVRLSVRSGVL